MKREARENLEIRVVSTGKGWRVDAHLIGALETTRVARFRGRARAIEEAKRIAEASRNLDYYGFVRLMIEEK